ncbi:TPA: hypothetical protein ACXE8V_003447, partial [Pluralibacter gergoviae]
LNNPGSRQQKSPLRGTSDSAVWLSGTARLDILSRFASARIPAGCPGQTAESEAILSRSLKPSVRISVLLT